jgi:endonuclease YncB( thermonuclease family)
MRIGALGLLATLALGLAVGLVGCGDGGAGLDRLAPGEQGRVAEVRSGDVVVLDSGLTVRLAGVEAPRAGEPGADQARAALAGLVRGKRITLSYGGERRDGYGRALAQARLADGRAWVQGALLSKGWVRVRTWADNQAMASAMLDAEAKARRGKLGLWAMPDYSVRLPAEVGREVEGFQIVEGRVRDARDQGEGVRVDLEGEHDGFSVELTRQAAADLAAAGHPVAGLVGKLVRVRGVIRRDGLMRLDHAAAVEVLRER